MAADSAASTRKHISDCQIPMWSPLCPAERPQYSGGSVPGSGLDDHLRPLCRMPESLRHGYTVTHPDIVPVIDPALLEHRDTIYERHLELPIEL